MATIPKTYEYKIYRGSTYLGLLPNVTSDFSYSQSINAAGSQLTINIGDTPDTAKYEVSTVTDETGGALLTEDGVPLTTEREDDLVGSTNENALIQNDNIVKVYEVSDSYPNGLLVFTGYISKWRALFGGADSVEITVLSDGQDLNQWVIPGGSAYTIDVDQSSKDSDIGFWAARRYGQTFTTGSATNIGRIRLSLLRGSAGDRTVTLKLWSSSASATIGGTPLGSSSVVISNTSYQDVDFIFSTPVTVIPSTQYFFSIEADSGSVSGDSTTWVGFEDDETGNPYAGGGMYRSVSGAAWDDSTTAGYDFYFKTYSFEESIERLYQDRDPSYILNDIMANYGGSVAPYETFADTGITIPSYTFKLNTVLEGIKIVGELSPANWYWYVDPSDNTLYFQETSTTAEIQLIKGKHINLLDIEGTKETVVTKAYFSGGDDGTGDNVFVLVTDTNTNNRLGIVRLSDLNVNGTNGASTAAILAQNYIDGHNTETYRTSVTVQDGNIDTNLFKIGMVIGFAGFGTFVDRLLLQVVGLEKYPDHVRLQLGELRPQQSQTVSDIQYSLSSTQVKDNPNIPS